LPVTSSLVTCHSSLERCLPCACAISRRTVEYCSLCGRHSKSEAATILLKLHGLHGMWSLVWKLHFQGWSVREKKFQTRQLESAGPPKRRRSPGQLLFLTPSKTWPLWEEATWCFSCSVGNLIFLRATPGLDSRGLILIQKRRALSNRAGVSARLVTGMYR